MSYIGNIPTTAAFVTDQFSANGSGTTFTLSAAPATTSSILVAVSGVLQDPSTYSVSGTTLTFSAAPPAGTGNISVRFLGIPASGVVTTAYRTVTDFTATAGQTTFSPPSYTAGFIDVYRNGVKLGAADFTATNGTTVVLANACTAGDLVQIVSFQVSSVLNAIPATAGAVNSTYLLDGSVTQAKLGAGVAGNGPAFFGFRTSSTQSLTANTWSKVNLNGEGFDTASCFNQSNGRFTPNVAGYYQFNGAVHLSGSITRYLVGIYRNGTEEVFVGCDITLPSSVGQGSGSVCGVLYMNGTTDYVELYVYGTGSSLVIDAGSQLTNMTGALVRAA